MSSSDTVPQQQNSDLQKKEEQHMKKIIFYLVLLMCSSLGQATQVDASPRPEQTAVLFVYSESSKHNNPALFKSFNQQFQRNRWEVVMYPVSRIQMQSNFRYLALDRKIQSLADEGFERIMIIGYDDTNKLITYYLSGIPSKKIKAFVGINMTGHHPAGEDIASDNASSLLNIKIPVLDIFGSHSHPAVLTSIDRRAFAMALHRTDCDCQNSRQVVIKDANATFQGYETQLTMRITHWLDSI